MEIFHEISDVEVPRRGTTSRRFIQRQLSPKYRNVTDGSERCGNEKTSTIEPGLKVDDRVHISKAKRMFKKGYLPNWSDEIFTVKSVHRTDPPV